MTVPPSGQQILLELTGAKQPADIQQSDLPGSISNILIGRFSAASANQSVSHSPSVTFVSLCQRWDLDCWRCDIKKTTPFFPTSAVCHCWISHGSRTKAKFKFVSVCKEHEE